MHTAQVIPERVSLIERGQVTLLSGAHKSGQAVQVPEMCFTEAVSWISGGPFTDAPSCISPVLRDYTMRLNDRWSDADRQLLLPYVVRCVGTAGDGQNEARMAIAQAALTVDLMPPWLRLAGLDDLADEMASMKTASRSDLRAVLDRAYCAASEKRTEARRRIEAKIREHLLSREALAAAAAVAVAVAVAVAAAAAAAADAAADAAAAAAWGVGYPAAKKVRSDWYATSPEAQQIRDLATAQRAQALIILDQMIDPAAAVSA